MEIKNPWYSTIRDKVLIILDTHIFNIQDFACDDDIVFSKSIFHAFFPNTTACKNSNSRIHGDEKGEDQQW